MCRFLKQLFNKPQSDYQIPHPEEKQDFSQTAANTDIRAVLEQWLETWKVPAENWEWWQKKIDIKIYDAWPKEMLQSGTTADTPACTWESDGIRHLAALASWLNPGVIAHEQAHNSYALLSEMEKREFGKAYKRVKAEDPGVRYLFSINTYGLTNAVEGHAEIYRYIGDKMASNLKRFYPKLF